MRLQKQTNTSMISEITSVTSQTSKKSFTLFNSPNANKKIKLASKIYKEMKEEVQTGQQKLAMKLDSVEILLASCVLNFATTRWVQKVKSHQLRVAFRQISLNAAHDQSVINSIQESVFLGDPKLGHRSLMITQRDGHQQLIKIIQDQKSTITTLRIQMGIQRLLKLKQVELINSFQQIKQFAIKYNKISKLMKQLTNYQKQMSLDTLKQYKHTTKQCKVMKAFLRVDLILTKFQFKQQYHSFMSIINHESSNRNKILVKVLTKLEILKAFRRIKDLNAVQLQNSSECESIVMNKDLGDLNNITPMKLEIDKILKTRIIMEPQGSLVLTEISVNQDQGPPSTKSMGKIRKSVREYLAQGDKTEFKGLEHSKILSALSTQQSKEMFIEESPEVVMKSRNWIVYSLILLIISMLIYRYLI